MIDLARGVKIQPDELQYRATASGGPGGQNVNKVATRIELTWDLNGSPSLHDSTRERLLAQLGPKLDTDGKLRVVASDQRTQKANRAAALARLCKLVADALKPRKKRKPTKPTKASKQRRLDAKKVRGDIKRQRRRDD
ncbi:MAG: aminoacyl-tRNA hydrolase [Planctomycetes bacterium]|nr:aminoacyl-tRNA hydrolase [Planctomycetota bacterium]